MEQKPARKRRDHRRKKIDLTPRRVVEPSGYREYIQSEAWQEQRRRLAASGRRRDCYGCGRADGPKDVHHRTYDNLGNERLRDLVFLCRACHDRVHELHRNTPGLSLWEATKAVRRELHPTHSAKALAERRIARAAARAARKARRTRSGNTARSG